MAIETIDLREIDKNATNVYEAIIVSGKKSRQINDDRKIEFNAMLSTVPNQNTDDESEDFDNPAQSQISDEFEKRPKPHIEALNTLLEGELKYHYKN